MLFFFTLSLVMIVCWIVFGALGTIGTLIDDIALGFDAFAMDANIQNAFPTGSSLCPSRYNSASSVNEDLRSTYYDIISEIQPKRRILQSAPPAVKCLKFTTRYPWMIIATGIKVKMINPISTTPIRSAEITTWTYKNTAVGRTFQKPWIPGKSTQLRVVDNTRNVILPPRKLLAGRHAAKTRSPLMLTMNSWRSSTTSGTFWPLKISSRQLITCDFVQSETAEITSTLHTVVDALKVLWGGFLMLGMSYFVMWVILLVAISRIANPQLNVDWRIRPSMGGKLSIREDKSIIIIRREK